MRLTLLFTALLCALVVGCNSAPKAPSGEEIRAALENNFKKDDPSATVKLTDIGMTPDKAAVTLAFDCTNCAVDDDGGGKKKLSAGEGTARLTTNYPEKRWYFSVILVKDDAGKSYSVSGLGQNSFTF